jgi:hypothetical protein
MPRPRVEDKKIKKNMRMKKSIIEMLKNFAKENELTETEVIENGIKLYIKQNI